jgi:hypothetical protein
MFNPLTPNDPYRGSTAPLTSKVAFYYSTNIDTVYFKHGIKSHFFSLQNAVCFIILTYLVPVLFKFYIQGVLKLKNNSGAKMLSIDCIGLLRNSYFATINIMQNTYKFKYSVLEEGITVSKRPDTK